jgi:hypothetical protein
MPFPGFLSRAATGSSWRLDQSRRGGRTSILQSCPMTVHGRFRMALCTRNRVGQSVRLAAPRKPRFWKHHAQSNSFRAVPCASKGTLGAYSLALRNFGPMLHARPAALLGKPAGQFVNGADRASDRSIARVILALEIIAGCGAGRRASRPRREWLSFLWSLEWSVRF